MASSAVVEGVSGAVGGIVALVATYPLMTITTLQATRSDKSDAKILLQPAARRHTGTLGDIADVIQKSGWQGLYRGLQASLLGTAMSQGVYFYLYSLLRQAFVARLQRRTRSSRVDIGVGASLVVAFLAGCGNVLLTNPIWVVATRMQAHQAEIKKSLAGEAGSEAAEASALRSAPGPLAVVQEVWAEHGLLGFWKGVLPSLVMVCNPTVNYMLYEFLYARLAELRTRVAKKAGSPAAAQLGAGDVFAVSAAAKLGATVATYPVLLVKSRLMSAGRHTSADRIYNGTAHAVQRIWRTEGPLGFFKGMRAKIVQSILAAALLMAIKEELSRVTAAALLPVQPVAPQPPPPIKEPIPTAGSLVPLAR